MDKSRGASIPPSQLTPADWSNRVNRLKGQLNKAAWSSWLQTQGEREGVGVVRDSPPITSIQPITTHTPNTSSTQRRPQSASMLRSLRHQSAGKVRVERAPHRETVNVTVNSLLGGGNTASSLDQSTTPAGRQPSSSDANDATVCGPQSLSADHLVTLNTLLVCIRGLVGMEAGKKVGPAATKTLGEGAPMTQFESLMSTLRGTSDSIDHFFVDNAVCAIAVLEAVASVLDNHPVLGPLMSCIHTFVSRGVLISANPTENGALFRGCRGFTPEELAAAVVERFNTHLKSSGTFAKRRQERIDERLGEEQHAVAIALNRSRLNKRIIQSHFKVWRGHTRNMKRIRKAASDTTQRDLNLKRTTLYGWRLEILKDKILKSRFDTSTIRQELANSRAETDEAHRQVRVLEEAARSADAKVNALERSLQMAEAELANSTSPMMFDFRKPVLDALAKTPIDKGVLHFCRASLYEQEVMSGLSEMWMGDFGCPHAPSGVAVPGMDLVKSHYVIRVLQPETTGKALSAHYEDENRVVKWVNETIERRCEVLISDAESDRAAARFADSFPLVRIHRQFLSLRATETKRWIQLAASMKVRRDLNVCVVEGTSRPPYFIDSVHQLAGNPQLYVLLLPATSLTLLVDKLANTTGAASRMPSGMHAPRGGALSPAINATVLFDELRRLGLTLHVSEEEFCRAHRSGTKAGNAILAPATDSEDDDSASSFGGEGPEDVLIRDIHMLVLQRLQALHYLGDAVDRVEMMRGEILVESAADPDGDGTVLQVGPTGVVRCRTEHILPSCVVPRGGAHQDSDEAMFGPVLDWVRTVLHRHSTFASSNSLIDAQHASSLSSGRKKSSLTPALLAQPQLPTAGHLLDVANFADDFGTGLEMIALLTQALRPATCPTGLSDLVQLVRDSFHLPVASEYLCRVAVQELGCSLSDYVVDNLHQATPQVRALFCTALYNTSCATHRFASSPEQLNLSPSSRQRSKSPRPNSSGRPAAGGRVGSPTTARLGASSILRSPMASSLMPVSTSVFEATILGGGPPSSSSSLIELGREVFSNTTHTPVAPPLVLPPHRIQDLVAGDDGASLATVKRQLTNVWPLLNAAFVGVASMVPAAIHLPRDSAYKATRRHGSAAPLHDEHARDTFTQTAGLMWGPEAALAFDSHLWARIADLWRSRETGRQSNGNDGHDAQMSSLQASFAASFSGFPDDPSNFSTEGILREIQVLRALRDCCVDNLDAADVWKLSSRLTGVRRSGSQSALGTSRRKTSFHKGAPFKPTASAEGTPALLSPKSGADPASNSASEMLEMSGSFGRPMSASLFRGARMGADATTLTTIRDELRASTADLRIVVTQFPEFVLRYSVYTRDMLYPAKKVEAWRGRNVDTLRSWVGDVFIPAVRYSLLLRGTAMVVALHADAGPAMRPTASSEACALGIGRYAFSFEAPVSSTLVAINDSMVPFLSSNPAERGAAMDTLDAAASMPLADLAMGRVWSSDGGTMPTCVEVVLRHPSITRLFAFFSCWHRDDRWFQLEKRILTAEGFLRLCCEVGWVGSRTTKNIKGMGGIASAAKPYEGVGGGGASPRGGSVIFQEMPHRPKRRSSNGDGAKHPPTRRASKLRLKQVITQDKRNVGGVAIATGSKEHGGGHLDLSSDDLEASTCSGGPTTHNCLPEQQSEDERLLARTALDIFFFVASLRTSFVGAVDPEMANSPPAATTPTPAARSKSVVSVTTQSQSKPRNLSVRSAPLTVPNEADSRFAIPASTFTGFAKDCRTALASYRADPRELLEAPPRNASLSYSGFLECLYHLAMAAYPYPWMAPSYRVQFLLHGILTKGPELVPGAFGLR